MAKEQIMRQLEDSMGQDDVILTEARRKRRQARESRIIGRKPIGKQRRAVRETKIEVRTRRQ